MSNMFSVWRSIMFWCEKCVLWCCASRYRLEGGMTVYKGRLLAEGGFSYVYIAYDASTGRRVVLKQSRVDDHEQMAAFLCEVESHRRFGNHRNLMPLLDYLAIEQKGLALMVFPLCSRGSLRHAIDIFVLEFNTSSSKNTWNILDFARIFNGVCLGVKAIHDLGYSHRDIKPENCLLDDDGTAILTDFGSVALAQVRLDKRRDALLLQDHAATHSTMTYRAPELWDPPPEISTINTTKADVWALGCLLWAMAFGYSPFEAEFPSSKSQYIKPRLVETSHLRVLATPPTPPLDSLPNVQQTSPQFFQSVLDASRLLLVLDPTERPHIDHVLDISANRLVALASLHSSVPSFSSSARGCGGSTSPHHDDPDPER